MSARLPAHLEVSALIRAVEAAGGFATVVKRGERDVGVVLILTRESQFGTRLWERMPRLDGVRAFVCVKTQTTDNEVEFDEYLARRMRSDPDSWVLELDVADAERFIDSALQ